MTMAAMIKATGGSTVKTPKVVLTEEEKEVEQGCGCAQRARGPAHAPPAAAPAAEAKAEADEAGPPLKDGHGPQGQQS